MNKFKKIIIGVIATGGLVGGIFISNDVKKMDNDNIEILSYEEYVEIIEFYDREIKNHKGEFKLEDINEQNNIIKRINEKLEI